MKQPKPTRSKLHSLTLNSCLTIIEVSIGIAIGSVALISDGLKNLTDSAMIAVSLIADVEATKHKNKVRQIRSTAAKINIGILVLVACDSGYVSINHLGTPHAVRGSIVIGVAIVAVAVNLVASFIIGYKKDVATKAAFFGLLSSAASGSCVLISGIVGYGQRPTRIDGIAGLVITLIIIIVAGRLTINLLQTSRRT